MTLPPPVRRGRERLDRNLEDALPDLAWLSRVYAGGRLGKQMRVLHDHIPISDALRAWMPSTPHRRPQHHDRR